MIFGRQSRNPLAKAGKNLFLFSSFRAKQPGVFEYIVQPGWLSRFSLGLPVPAEEAPGELVAGEGELVTRRGGGHWCDRLVCDRSLHAAYSERAFRLLSVSFSSPEEKRWRR